MTKPQKKKRNHWVSQAYLRSFAADDARRKIWRFGKDKGDPELKPIEKVAVRFYLYAPNSPQGRDYSFEDKLSSLEGWFGTPFWTSATSGYVDLSSKTVRKGLSLLTAVMFLRNPAYLAIMRDMHRAMVDLYSTFPTLPDGFEINGQRYELDTSTWPAYRDATEDDIKRMWLAEVGSAVWLAKLLMKMRWAILLAKEPAFVTSDNPVVVLHPSLKFRGFKDPDTTVFFPLSPTRILVLDNRHSEPDNQYYPLDGTGGVQNGLIFRYANEYMFFSKDPAVVFQAMEQDTIAMGFHWTEDGWRQKAS